MPLTDTIGSPTVLSDSSGNAPFELYLEAPLTTSYAVTVEVVSFAEPIPNEFYYDLRYRLLDAEEWRTLIGVHSEDSNSLLRTDGTPSGIGVYIPPDQPNPYAQADAWRWLVSRASVAITLTAPGVGAVLQVGSPALIDWSAPVIIANVRLEQSTDGGLTWRGITPSTPNDGAYSWTPATVSSAARIRITDAADPAVLATSAGDFIVRDTTAPPRAPLYERMLMRLLPTGPLWRRDTEGVVSAVMGGIGRELARVEVRGAALVDESDPRTASETLPDWERVLGLPDADILEIPFTDEERRLAVTQKLVKQGGQTPAYFLQLAAACGYTATIVEDLGQSVFRTGRGRAGQPVNSERWAHVWRMDVEPPTSTALTHADLERIIRRVAPAHTVVRFNYL